MRLTVSTPQPVSILTGFGNYHLQYAIFELPSNSIFINRLRQRKCSVKSSPTQFKPVVAFLFTNRIKAAFSLYGEFRIRKIHFDTAGFDTRKLGIHNVVIVNFIYIHRRNPGYRFIDHRNLNLTAPLKDPYGNSFKGRDCALSSALIFAYSFLSISTYSASITSSSFFPSPC